MNKSYKRYESSTNETEYFHRRYMNTDGVDVFYSRVLESALFNWKLILCYISSADRLDIGTYLNDSFNIVYLYENWKKK